MIDAAVEKSSVVRDEDEPRFALQIIRNKRSRLSVEVVGGLVYQQEAVLAQKQRRQQHLGALAVGERFERPPQSLLRNLQPSQLPQQPPVLDAAVYPVQHLACQRAHIAHLIRKILKVHACGNTSAVFIFAEQQIEKGGLSSAVSPGESEPPRGIDPERDVLKDVVVAAVIAECQVRHVYHGHIIASLTQKLHPPGNLPEDGVGPASKAAHRRRTP